MMVLLLQPPECHDYRHLYYAQDSCFCHCTMQYNLYPIVHQNGVDSMNKQLPCLIGLLGLLSLEGPFPGFCLWAPAMSDTVAEDSMVNKCWF